MESNSVHQLQQDAQVPTKKNYIFMAEPARRPPLALPSVETIMGLNKSVNCINCIFPFPVCTDSHYSHRTSTVPQLPTVLRGSCLFVILLYLYISPSQRSVCDCNKNYCIVLAFGQTTSGLWIIWINR